MSALESPPGLACAPAHRYRSQSIESLVPTPCREPGPTPILRTATLRCWAPRTFLRRNLGTGQAAPLHRPDTRIVTAVERTDGRCRQYSNRKEAEESGGKTAWPKARSARVPQTPGTPESPSAGPPAACARGAPDRSLRSRGLLPQEPRPPRHSANAPRRTRPVVREPEGLAASARRISPKSNVDCSASGPEISAVRHTGDIDR